MVESAGWLAADVIRARSRLARWDAESPQPASREKLAYDLSAAYAAIRALVSGGDREPHRGIIERAIGAKS